MMLFRHLALLLLIVLPTVAVSKANADTAQPKVRLLIWEEFISPKVIKLLKNRHGLVVEMDTFSSTDEREAILSKKRAEYDVVVADTIWSGEYRRRGWLEKLDASKLPNSKQVMARWRIDPDYSIPYLWGHTGIAWRTDKVDAPITTYAQLLALAARHPGKVSLIDDTHEALRAALYASGKSPWKMSSPEEVRAAEKLLQPHLPRLRFVGSELDEKSPWLDGSLIAGQAYNGDIAYLRDTYKAPLAFAVPSPGCMVFQEQLLLLKGARNKPGAYQLLNLLNDPALAARNASDVRYATPNVLAAEKLDAAFRADPVIRPTLDGLDGCYFVRSIDEPTQEALHKVKLKGGA